MGGDDEKRPAGGASKPVSDDEWIDDLARPRPGDDELLAEARRAIAEGNRRHREGTDRSEIKITIRSLYSERFLLALDTAARIHAGQRRKETDIPYVSHLLGTCAIALEYGADEDEAIAALLHDAIEDVEPADFARRIVASFGERVLHVVEGCTDSDEHPKPEWRPRKERYIGHLSEADASILLVSAADKLHNARAVVSDLRVDPNVWDRFKGGRDGTLWYSTARSRRPSARTRPIYHASSTSWIALSG